VPVPATLAAYLATHVAQTGRKGDDLIFGRTAREPFTPWTVGHDADTAWTKAKLGRVTLHEARHSYGSYLDAAGVSETRSARYLGHSLTAISDRYRHALPGQLAEDAGKLDAYLTGAAAGKVVPLQTGAQNWRAGEQTGS
jgi:integrase